MYLQSIRKMCPNNHHIQMTFNKKPFSVSLIKLPTKNKTKEKKRKKNSLVMENVVNLVKVKSCSCE